MEIKQYVEATFAIVQEVMEEKNAEYTRNDPELYFPFQNIIDRGMIQTLVPERIVAQDLLKKVLSILQRRLLFKGSRDRDHAIRLFIKIINYGIIGLAVVMKSYGVDDNDFQKVLKEVIHGRTDTDSQKEEVGSSR